MKTFLLKYILNDSQKETRFDAVNYLHALRITEAIMEGMGKDFGYCVQQNGQGVYIKAEFVSLQRLTP